MNLITIIALIVKISYCYTNILHDSINFSGNKWTCREEGMCNGVNFLIEKVTDMNECILLCLSSHNGKWSAYNPDNNNCWLFIDCPEIDTSICPNCVTNQRECDILCKYYRGSP